MSSLSNIEENGTFQGRPEGAVRKCHRLCRKADFLESCEKFEEALECHKVSCKALQTHLQSQISVTSRNQVKLLIDLHQTRIFFLKRLIEERKNEPASPYLLSGSFTETGDENARFYFSHTPTALMEIKKSQVQFNNAMDQLQSLISPEDLTKGLEVSDMMNAEDKALAKADNASKSSKADTAATGSATGASSHSEQAPDCTESTGKSDGGYCKQCNKSFERRLREEERLLRLVVDLPAVWRGKDRTLMCVITDYVRMAKSRDHLQDQVKQLTCQLEQLQSQAEQQAQLMSCSNITYNTTDPDPTDLTTSETQDATGSCLSVLGGGAHTSACSGTTSEFHHVQQPSSLSTLGSGYSYGGGSSSISDQLQQTMAGGGMTSLASSGYDQITSAMEKMACASKAATTGGATHQLAAKAGTVSDSLDKRGAGLPGHSTREVKEDTSHGLPILEPASFSAANLDLPPL